MIKDSGNRTEYSTGAVRDLKEGKGRCDLMPLDVVCNILGCDGSILEHIYKFQQDNSKIECLHSALNEAGRIYYTEGLGEYDIDKINANMFLDASIHFEEGAKKYGEHNWQKGIPIQSYIDSSVRHYLKHIRGDKDENHLRAFVWNIMCLIWTVSHQELGGEKDVQVL